MPQGLICAFSSSRLPVYLFLLSGRSRSPTLNCSSLCPLGRTITFPFQTLLFTSRTSPDVIFLSPCFLTLADLFFLSIILLLSCTPQRLHGQCSWFLSYLLPHFIDYVISPYSSSHFRYVLQAALLAMDGNLFLACSLLFNAISTLSSPYSFLEGLLGCIPSSALVTVFLVELDHPNTILAAAIGTVSSYFTDFAFPAHTYLAYSSFGYNRIYQIHFSVLVSRCEPVRIASILPTCTYPFSLV